jgi:outer membrane protein OmpA-like peptidoglycan-associated protein
MTGFRPTLLRLALIPVAAALVMACASPTMSNARLDEARALYTQASNDPEVARTAPLELRRAQQALNQASAALKSGEDVSVVEHYAYLARQRSATAMQTGEISRAEKSVSASSRDRDRILMDARTQEASRSSAQARAALEQAEAARLSAIKAREEAQAQLAAAQAAKAKADKLQAELAALQAQQTDRGMVLTLGDVLFDTGRAKLKSGAFVTVDRLATFLRENPERSVAIEGYTDSVGSEAYNQSLSLLRADAVRTALSERGIASNRVSTQGFGEAKPVASNNTAEGRQRNRRVEVVISNGS